VPKTYRNVLIAISILIVVAIAIEVFALYSYRYSVAPTYVTPRPFESSGWESGSATRRHEMAEYMSASGELIGLTWLELVARLGVPTKEHDDGVLEWEIGNREGSFFLPEFDEYLRIVMDKNGRCVKAEVWSDDQRSLDLSLRAWHRPAITTSAGWSSKDRARWLQRCRDRRGG